MSRPRRYPLMSLAVLSAALLAAGQAQAAPDEGKRACLVDAKVLCKAEMRSMSRKRVQACLIAKIDQTSPVCHTTMLKLKAAHEAALPAKK